MQGRSIRKYFTRNRKRSKRRAIFCPIHACYLESRSPKYKLLVDQEKELAAVKSTVATHGEVPRLEEWLEAFWCSECQERRWYCIKESSPRSYEVEFASQELSQQLLKYLGLVKRCEVGAYSPIFCLLEEFYRSVMIL